MKVSVKTRFLIWLAALLLGTGCVQFRAPLGAGELAAPVSEAVAAAAFTAVAPTRSLPTPTPPLRLTPGGAAPTATATAVPTVSPPAPPAPTAVIAPEQTVAAVLAQAIPPVRDDVRLALAYRGLAPPPAPAAPPTDAPLAVGARERFNVPDVVNNVTNAIEAELLAVSDHAYFWFDTGPGVERPDAAVLADAAARFDAIYAQVVFYFGQEASPGLDGDPRLHIVHASPVALCGVSVRDLDGCALAGLVNTVDLLPVEVDPRSNAREMFVMNARRFGGDYYLGVLAHEFRHLIEDRYDKAGADWEKEGSATLAAHLLGLPGGGVERGNAFLANPDQQLNSWREANTGPYYGQGYLLNRYLFDQVGVDVYRDFAVSPLPGLLAVDAVAQANGLALTGESLWLDWLAALAIHDHPQAPPRYRFENTGLNTAAAAPVDAPPAAFTTTVHQYAADYYELPAEGGYTLTFEGAARVPLLEAPPAAGEWLWVAQRANYSNPRLTRAVDLRGVTQATLHYAAYVDLEQGYDFAYAAVSVDDGRTWRPLVAGQMQGLGGADDPAGAAHAERFYTGRRRAWLQETADLSPYAGQQILLRFEVVTDAILTYGGFALDEIAIPAIGFYDGAETPDPGWRAEGFTRAAAYLPQRWHVQLITFPQGVPVVELLPLADGRRASRRLEVGERRPLLIIAASAPQTLASAHYTLEVK